MGAHPKFTLSPTDHKLIAAAEELTKLAPLAVHKVAPWLEDSVNHLAEVDELKKQGILVQIRTYTEIVRHCAAHVPQPDFERTTLDDESNFVDSALSHYNLRLGSDFKHLIRSGDIIEMYSLQGIQIYRNFEFFRYCSYDFLTLMTNDWNTLYERSDEITKRIFEAVGEVLKTPESPRPFGVAPHLMRERYLKNRRVFEIYLDSVAPLVERDTGKLAGFICNQRGSRLVTEGLVSDGAEILMMSRKRN